MPSSVIALRSETPLTPAMTSVVWELAAILDERRVPAENDNSVWVDIPAKRLRGEGARSDNIWLRECLNRLMGITLSGEYRGSPWGAVVLSEYHIEEGGAMVRLLIPPSGLYALRSPSSFAKIETEAAHRLGGHARRLYAILADKKRLGKPTWTFSLEELKVLMAVESKKSYARFNNFRQYVLDPAIKSINSFGTVEVTATPIKLGRSVHDIRFDWRWKSIDETRDTERENSRHSKAHQKEQASDDAPPLIDDTPQKGDAQTWWTGLSDAERDAWSDHVGRYGDRGYGNELRPERILRELAYEAFSQGTVLSD